MYVFSHCIIQLMNNLALSNFLFVPQTDRILMGTQRVKKFNPAVIDDCLQKDSHYFSSHHFIRWFYSILSRNGASLHLLWFWASFVTLCGQLRCQKWYCNISEPKHQRPCTLSLSLSPLPLPCEQPGLAYGMRVMWLSHPCNSQSRSNMCMRP